MVLSLTTVGPRSPGPNVLNRSLTLAVFDGITQARISSRVLRERATGWDYAVLNKWAERLYQRRFGDVWHRAGYEPSSPVIGAPSTRVEIYVSHAIVVLTCEAPEMIVHSSGVRPAPGASMCVRQ